MRRRLLLAAGVLVTLASASAEAETPPSLGAAASFAVLGGSAVTSSAPSTLTGNVGVSPGKNISGITPGHVRLGDLYRDDALARQAQRDNAAAHADLARRT